MCVRLLLNTRAEKLSQHGKGGVNRHRSGRRAAVRLDPDVPLASSADVPLALVNVELHRAFVAHLQQQRLAGFLIGQIGALHDFKYLERLFAQRRQDFFAIVEHVISLADAGLCSAGTDEGGPLREASIGFCAGKSRPKLRQSRVMAGASTIDRQIGSCKQEQNGAPSSAPFVS
jgi:hypothetical protein